MLFNLQLIGEVMEPVDVNQLLSFKFRDGTSFPASYIQFAKQYGYGIACGEFLIYMPLGNHCDSFSYQSQAILDTYSDVLKSSSDVWFDLEPDVDFEKLKRLIPFAKSEKGNYLRWDSERSNPEEMDIYITDFRGLGFIKAASNIHELIAKMTSASRFREVFPLFYQQELPATFKALQKSTN